ncbi:hypothetical protein CLOSTMETH_02267 [[Clostridium] methylpentosum DSM 5476]|uniref:Uncharacterized protein n=1 Tax=[Clostridium] methylpentosum DSM 5476 TaxID=537013 RepID=C0EEI1_9FIRM|nr:hypothetical protein CLOSTMETH_02267 [[Clostridium] methylpentosum DSM 5476]
MCSPPQCNGLLSFLMGCSQCLNMSWFKNAKDDPGLRIIALTSN